MWGGGEVRSTEEAAVMPVEGRGGDGILDLAGTVPCSPHFCEFGILLGNGDGTFSRYFSALLEIPANQGVLQVVTGDFRANTA